MLLSPAMLKGNLLDAQQGNGISPSVSQMLIDEGWAEWVDHEFGTPIDENSPRSLMRLTVAGHGQLEALAAMTFEQVIATQPAPKVPPPVQVTLPAQPGARLRIFPIRFRPLRVA